LNTSLLTLLESTLTGNAANGDGGGILNFGDLEVLFSTLSQNTATANGGGISNYSMLDLFNSLISFNSAGLDGGGVGNFGAATVDNSTLSQNRANGNGGGIANANLLQVVNATLFGNRADADGNGTGTGGGLWTSNTTFASSKVFNSIVAGNVQGSQSVPSDIANKNLDPVSTNNLIGDPNSAGGLIHEPVDQNQDGIENIVGDGNGNVININTVLDTMLRDNGGPTFTHALNVKGPAVNAGINVNPEPLAGGIVLAAPPTQVKKAPGSKGGTPTPPDMVTPPTGERPDQALFDQRGPNFFRVTGGRIDIGAFEVQFHIDLALGSGGGIDATVQIFSTESGTRFQDRKPFTIEDPDPPRAFTEVGPPALPVDFPALRVHQASFFSSHE
jgi:hypothetical protein